LPKTGFFNHFAQFLHHPFCTTGVLFNCFANFQLTSGSDEAKVSALMGIGCLENVELSREALRTIAPLLLDPSTTIQVAATNALR